MEQARLITFHLEDPGKRQKLELICRQLKICIHHASDQEETVPLLLVAEGGATGDHRDPMQAQEPPLSEEMIVMCGYEDALLDTFLARCRQEGCSISLKAVLTKTNGGWTARLLQSMLRDERAQIMRQMMKEGIQRR